MSLGDAGIIAVIRLAKPLPLTAARAIAAGGIGAIELTLTTPGAFDSIAELTRSLPDSLIGAGTVLDASAAERAIAAGARFCVSPVYVPEVHQTCRTRNIPYVPGAFTPAELLHAHRAGVDFIKLFPAKPLGPGFLRDVLAPMPFLRIIPSGGIGLADAAAWIGAGAVAVSVGTSLLDSGDTASEEVTARAKSLVAAVRSAR